MQKTNTQNTSSYAQLNASKQQLSQTGGLPKKQSSFSESKKQLLASQSIIPTNSMKKRKSSLRSILTANSNQSVQNENKVNGIMNVDAEIEILTRGIRNFQQQCQQLGELTEKACKQTQKLRRESIKKPKSNKSKDDINSDEGNAVAINLNDNEVYIDTEDEINEDVIAKIYNGAQVETIKLLHAMRGRKLELRRRIIGLYEEADRQEEQIRALIELEDERQIMMKEQDDNQKTLVNLKDLRDNIYNKWVNDQQTSDTFLYHEDEEEQKDTLYYKNFHSPETSPVEQQQPLHYTSHRNNLPHPSPIISRPQQLRQTPKTPEMDFEDYSPGSNGDYFQSPRPQINKYEVVMSSIQSQINSEIEQGKGLVEIKEVDSSDEDDKSQKHEKQPLKQVQKNKQSVVNQQQKRQSNITKVKQQIPQKPLKVKIMSNRASQNQGK